MTEILANAPSAVPVRRRQLLVGTSFSVAVCLMYFGALFGFYFSERADFTRLNPTQPWILGDVQLTAPTMMFWTFLLSIITMQWAVHAAARQERSHLMMAVAITGIFGIANINQTVFTFVQMGLVLDDGSLSAPLIYTILSSFLVMLVGALVFLATMGFRSLGAGNFKDHANGLSAVAIFWYAMVFIYTVLWLGIFITK